MVLDAVSHNFNIEPWNRNTNLCTSHQKGTPYKLCYFYCSLFEEWQKEEKKSILLVSYCSRWSTVGLLLSSDLCNCNRSTLSWIKHICLCYTSHCTGCLGLEHTSLKMWYLCEACCGLREEVSSTQRVCQRPKPHLQVSLAKISHKTIYVTSAARGQRALRTKGWSTTTAMLHSLAHYYHVSLTKYASLNFQK